MEENEVAQHMDIINETVLIDGHEFEIIVEKNECGLFWIEIHMPGYFGLNPNADPDDALCTSFWCSSLEEAMASLKKAISLREEWDKGYALFVRACEIVCRKVSLLVADVV